jgi:molecular chaperone GrpE
MSDEIETTEEASESDSGELDVTAEAMAEANEAIAEEADAQAQTESNAEESDSSATEPVESVNDDDLRADRDKYFEQWRRTQAELENYRKRVQREAELAAKFASLPLIRDLLPALDNVSRTVQAAEQTSNVDDLVQGLQMVQKQFDDIFARHSASPIKAVGEMFDPNLHEALQQVPTDEHPPMTVIQELERGYMLDDRVIRPTKVLVAAPLPEASTEEAVEES